MICDLACFVGTWPFRSLPASGLDGLKAMAERHGVRRAAVSSFEEVFWEDSFEGTRRMVETVADEPWLSPFQVLNLTVPGWERDLERGVRDLGIKGIRLTPNYHGYDLAEVALQACNAAATFKLPIAIHIRLQDERMHWIHSFHPVPAEAIEAFLDCSGGTRVALLGGQLSDWGRLAEAVKGRENVWVDLSRLRAMLFGADRLFEVIPPSQCVHASLWPLQTPSSMLNLFKYGRMDEDAKRAVLWENDVSFLDGA